jgi:hypothetical protein
MKKVAHVTEESGTLVDAVTSHLNHPARVKHFETPGMGIY